MLQAIALAITCCIRFAFENLTERFICLVLEEFALVGIPAEQVSGDQLLARAGLVRERPQPRAYLAFDNLNERLMRHVLEKSALVGNLAEQVSEDQLLARAGLVREHPQPRA